MIAKPHLILPLALVLGACQDQQPGAPATQAQATASDVTAASTGSPRTKAFDVAFPADVTLSFAHHARSVKIVRAKDGTPLQRFTMESLGIPFEDIPAMLVEDMTRAGFTTAGSKKRKNGSYRLDFSRDGYGNVIAVVQQGDPTRYRHPDASGIVRLAFPATESIAHQ